MFKKTLLRKFLGISASLLIALQSLGPVVPLLALPSSASAQEESTSSTETQALPEPTDSTSSPQVAPEVTAEPTPSPEPTIESLPLSVQATPEVVQEGDNSNQDQASGDQNPDANNSAPPATPESTPTSENVNVEEVVESGELSAILVHNNSPPVEGLDLGLVEDSSASITTDKDDYSPTDSVLITGSSFLPNTTYALKITSSDEPPVDFETEITTDENGSFVYVYQLDGTYRPNYKVEVKDSQGNIVATITFTDDIQAAIPFLDTFGISDSSTVISWDEQNPAEIIGTTSGEDATRDGTLSNKFAKIGQSSGGTDGFIRRTINATGFQSLQLKYYWKGDSDAESNDDGIIEYCSGATCTSFPGGNQLASHSLNNSSWSGQQTINLPVSLNNSVFRIRFRNDSSSSDEYFRVDQVEITAIPAITWPNSWDIPQCSQDPENDKNPDEVDLESGNSSQPAASYKWTSDYLFLRERVNGNPGSPGNLDQFAWVVLVQNSGPKYQYLISLDGLAEKLKLYANNQVTAQDVLWSPIFNDPAEGAPLWEGNSSIYSKVDTSSNDYFVSFAIPTSVLSQYNITQSSTLFFATSTDANNFNKDHLNCYEVISDVSISKSDNPDPVTNGGTLTYTLTINNGGPDTATGVVVNDTLPAGFTPTIITLSQGSCSGTTAPTLQCELGTINNGGNATVTIVGTITGSGTVTNTASVSSSTLDTNTSNNSDSEDTTIQQPSGTLVVHKTFTDQYSNFGITINLSGDATGSEVTDGNGDATFSNLTAGTYSAVAVEPQGYYESDTTCSSVSVAGGQTTNCTITDSPIKGTITVHKTIIGTSTNLSQFCFTLSSDPGNGEVCADSQTGDAVFTDVPFGTYSAAETDSASDYSETDNNCQDLTITNNGDLVSCTITNTRNQGEITFEKVVSGGTAQPSDWTFTINGNNYQSGDSGAFDTGDYPLTESGPDGYTLTDASGVCSLGQDGNVTVSVTTEGGTCTITNTRDTGTLQVLKNVDLNGDGDYEDEGETGATDWEWQENGSADHNTGDSAITVNTGDYALTETSKTDFHQVGLSCTGGTLTSNSVAVTTGANVVCTFTNARDTGSIQVNKQVDTDGDGIFESSNDEANDLGFRWGIDSETPEHLMGDTASPLPTGSYSINENEVENYHFVGWFYADNEGSCEDGLEGTDLPAEISVSQDEQTDITLCNARDTGSITVIKDVDENGDGDWDDEGERDVRDWSWDITDGEQDIATGDSKTLVSGSYTISEDEKPGYGLVDWSCTNDQAGTTNSISLEIVQGSEIVCTFANVKLPTVLEISKSNNASGDLHNGDVVTYSIFVHNPNNLTVFNVFVTDLLSDGFTYVSGSWTANSDDPTRGDLKIASVTTEPTYASPGVWQLGDMPAGEIVTLTYQAKIGDSVDAGTYEDLAWALGCQRDVTCQVNDGGAILATAIDPGFVDTNYVGTQVTVVKEPYTSYEVERGEVLALTTLPETGANIGWIILASVFLTGGLGSIVLAGKLRKKYE